MNTFSTKTATPPEHVSGRTQLESVVVRFAGDSGDGIQVLGAKFAAATALSGNDLATFPDFPAEIRAPAGTTYGVSAFQINFGGRVIKTAGDAPDVLVAMNPAALKVELPNLRSGGLLLVDAGSFSERTLRKAGYAANPLVDGALDGYRRIEIDISAMTLEAVKSFGLSQKDALRCKNMWTLGLVYWMYDRERDATVAWLRRRFAKQPDVAEANVAALNAGHAYGETAELSGDLVGCVLPPAPIAPGLYRTVTGSEALAWGLMAGAHLAGLRLFFSSYPITPASPILHILTANRDAGVETLQAEDEIAAVCAAIGGSYAGAIGVTSSSGPGIALKAEAIGLAVSTELPLVIVDTQRAGPSTGMPTKTEQSDLNLAMFGRHGESPVAVLAARSPSDCFDVAVEAVRIATRYMTPVMVLSDGYIANAAQPWNIPDIAKLLPFPVRFAEAEAGATAAPAAAFCPTRATRRPAPARGRRRARPGWSIASAGSRRARTSGIFPMTPAITSAWLTNARARSPGSPKTFRSSDLNSAMTMARSRSSAGARPTVRSTVPWTCFVSAVSTLRTSTCATSIRSRPTSGRFLPPTTAFLWPK